MNRAQRLALLAGTMTAVGAAYACTSNGTVAPNGPPVNEDSGPPGDSGPPVTTDGGDAIAPNPTTDGGDAGTPTCESLPGTKLYIESADTQEALLDTVGRQLRDNANVTIIFELTGSCTVTPNMYGTGSGPVPLPANSAMLYIPSTAENPGWTTADVENGCTTSAAIVPDLGISALFPSSCAGYSSLPQGNMHQFIGPTQAYTFIVPPAEFTGGQTSITAWEAYYAFGFGATNPVTINTNTQEWNDPTQFFLRPGTKSTLVSTALNIGLPPAKMTDVTADGGTADGRNLVASSSGCLADVVAATSPQAIGILGDEVYDPARGTVSILAFQDTIHGQNAAYFPDSTQTSFDKQNIRDGHYTMWSPDVYMAPATAGVATNATVQYLLDIILGNPGATPPAGAPDGGAAIDGLAITAGVGLTPSCAMQVTRSGDGAPLTAYTPTAPCTCKFLSDVKTATVPASCTTCTTSADCTATGTLGCFNGFCESPPVVIASDGGPSCETGSIVNACTNAQAVTKQVNYPTDDGGLESPPQ